MAWLFLLVITAGLLLETYGLETEGTEGNTGSVFVSQQSAFTVLRRQRRYNSGIEELVHKDNLERECIEERCNMEEAREVFENDEQTMEFWVRYTDGDQCESAPCQNGGQCKDEISAYVCWCQPNFNGKNCEIEVAKQCSVNNGGCSHFCEMKSERAVCYCAAGYRLGPDKRSCEPTHQFPCGRVSESIISSSRSILTKVSSGITHTSEINDNSNNTLLDEEDDFNATLEYEYEDYLVNVSDLLTSALSSTVIPPQMIINTTTNNNNTNNNTNTNNNNNNTTNNNNNSRGSGQNSSATEIPPSETSEKQKQPSWAFPTIPTITAQQNEDQRIVGGNEAIPGEIPWQVSLMTRSKQRSFCGGSLLSEVWVITAAHCLTEANKVPGGYFVRLGEHDVHQTEGTERDHMVEKEFIHHSYDSQRSQYNHDIALLRLSSPVELSDRSRPICLGPKDFIETLLRESRTSMVSGWGRLKFMGPEASKLQKLEVPYVDRTKCKGSSRDHITRFMFCAGYHSEQRDSCQGDSGGPHVTNYQGTWFLTGIVSWGEECAREGKYGVYTRVSRYYPWISQITRIRIDS